MRVSSNSSLVTPSTASTWISVNPAFHSRTTMSSSAWRIPVYRIERISSSLSSSCHGTSAESPSRRTPSRYKRKAMERSRSRSRYTTSSSLVISKGRISSESAPNRVRYASEAAWSAAKKWWIASFPES